MNFNFKEILDMFTGHWKFLAFLVLVTATFTGFVLVPLGKSYFESGNYSCSKCLDENQELVGRVLEISALLREYTEKENMIKSINRQSAEMIIESMNEDTLVSAPMIAVENAHKQINQEKDNLIERVKELSDLDN